MTESILDFPKESLCPEIWEKVININGTYEIWQIKPEVEQQIKTVVLKTCEFAKIEFEHI
jgi:hypothetical protein